MHGFDTPKPYDLSCGFLLDNCSAMGYCIYMLSGIRILSEDPIWRQILSELNATVLDTPTVTDVNIANLDITAPVHPMELKARILSATDNSRLLGQIFGTPTTLPYIQGKLLIALYKSGGMSSSDLKHALGYAADTSTHTVDTAIYQLRRKFGRDFIITNNGKYKLGRI